MLLILNGIRSTVLALMGTRMHDIKRMLNVSNEVMNSSGNTLVEFGVKE
jgi:hypothetical protein